MSSASLKSERLSAGSSRWRSPSAVRKDQPIPSTSTVGPRLPAGSQPRFTAKARMRISPTQKVGTEKPRTESAMISRADALSGR